MAPTIDKEGSGKIPQTRSYPGIDTKSEKTGEFFRGAERKLKEYNDIRSALKETTMFLGLLLEEIPKGPMSTIQTGAKQAFESAAQLLNSTKILFPA
jgi:hypothetical protein